MNYPVETPFKKYIFAKKRTSSNLFLNVIQIMFVSFRHGVHASSTSLLLLPVQGVQRGRTLC